MDIFCYFPSVTAVFVKSTDGMNAREKKNTLGVSVCFSQQPLCPLLLRHTLQGAAQLDVNISDCIVVRRAGVDTLKLAVFVLINVAKCGFGIGTLARELISVDYYTPTASLQCLPCWAVPLS